MSVGAYSICYKEADWLGFQITRMYDWLDEFSICVGPVERLMGSEPDTETAEALRALPDPEDKIHVVEGVWKDKNEMAQKAIEHLPSDIVFQVDSDEVWPKRTFDAALKLLQDGKRKVVFHLYEFWKSPEYIMEIPDVPNWVAQKLGLTLRAVKAAKAGMPGAQAAIRESFRNAQRMGFVRSPQERMDVLKILFEGVERSWNSREDRHRLMAADCLASNWSPWLLDMHRAFRRCEHTHISHIPPDLVWPNGESAHWNQGITLKHPIWHFSYIGDERVSRKFEFFNKRGEKMPPVEEFVNWVPRGVGSIHTMTGQLRRTAKYTGPELPADVKAFSERMI